MEDMKKIWKREEIPVEHTWATEDLYPSDEAWEAALATLEADKATMTAFAGKLGQSGEVLFDYLENMGCVFIDTNVLCGLENATKKTLFLLTKYEHHIQTNNFQTYFVYGILK